MKKCDEISLITRQLAHQHQLRNQRLGTVPKYNIFVTSANTMYQLTETYDRPR